MKGFILAGGKSKRFGEDKLLYELDGKKVIERVVKSAMKVCEEVFIIAKHPKKFEFLNVPVIMDAFPFQASIVGLYTALSYTERPALILSGDIPLITPRILERLISAYQEPITLARTESKIHTLIGVYSPKILETVEEFLKRGNYKLYDLVKEVGFKTVNFSGEEAFYLLNLNTKEDLRVIKDRKVN